MPKEISLAEYTKQRSARQVRCPLCKVPQDVQRQVQEAVEKGTASMQAIAEWLKMLGYHVSPRGVTGHVKHIKAKTTA